MRCTLRSLSRLMTFLPNLLRIFRSLRYLCHFFFSSRRRHTRLTCDWSSDVCSSDLIVDQYRGEASALWTDGEPDGAEVLRRLKALPGFGEQKAKIFLALLGKQYGVTPKGWREAAGDYGKAGSHLSVADIVDAGSLEQVRSYKKKMKAAAKAAKPTNAVKK